MTSPELAQKSQADADPLIPFERVAKFVRQLSHDFRNHLGAIDLQSAFIAELAEDPELLAEVKKLREMVTNSTKMLQGISGQFWVAAGNPITVSARIVMEDFRDRLARVLPQEAPQIEWEVELGEELITVDLELIFQAFSECFRNAFHFRAPKAPIAARAAVENGFFTLTLREPKAAAGLQPERWGRDPLVSTRRGGYGLGLYHARQILALHGGDVEFAMNEAEAILSTRIALPLGSETPE